MSTKLLAPCPACGADRPMGETLCPACGAAGPVSPRDAQEGRSERRQPQASTDTGVGIGGRQKVPARPGTPRPAAWIWIRALLWVAAGWFGADVVAHLLHAL